LAAHAHHLLSVLNHRGYVRIIACSVYLAIIIDAVPVAAYALQRDYASPINLQSIDAKAILREMRNPKHIAVCDLAVEEASNLIRRSVYPGTCIQIIPDAGCNQCTAWPNNQVREFHHSRHCRVATYFGRVFGCANIHINHGVQESVMRIIMPHKFHVRRHIDDFNLSGRGRSSVPYDGNYVKVGNAQSGIFLPQFADDDVGALGDVKGGVGRHGLAVGFNEGLPGEKERDNGCDRSERTKQEVLPPIGSLSSAMMAFFKAPLA